MSLGSFRTRTAMLLVGISTVSFLGMGLLFVFGPDFKPTHSGGANSYSISAVGHAALHDLLDARDVPVSVYRDPRRDPLPGKGVLLVLEPMPWLVQGDGRREPLLDLLGASPAVLLALPKWRPLLERGNDPHARGVTPWSADEALAPLRALGIEATLSRPLDEARTLFPADAEGRRPAFDTQYRQTVVSREIQPLITSEQGMLLGRLDRGGTEVYVLADPDLLANHGLHRGQNAELVLSWIDALRHTGPVVFDETMHGFDSKDASLMREVFRFPLVLVVVHLVLVVGLLLWAGLGRFGDAPPPKPPLEPGSGFLIHQTAALLRFGGHRDKALRRYLQDTARDVGTRFHLPGSLRGGALDAHLDTLGSHRGVSQNWSELKRHALAAASGRSRGSEFAVLRAAQDLHGWKQEMLDATRADS